MLPSLKPLLQFLEHIDTEERDSYVNGLDHKMDIQVLSAVAITVHTTQLIHIGYVLAYR